MTAKYEMVEGKQTGELAIRLLESPYEGVIVKVGKVAIHEEADGASLAFDYDILKGDPESEGQNFGEVLGNIIVDIIENHTSEILENNDGNDGEDNPSQLDAE